MKGWELYDWEEIANLEHGHHEIVRLLKDLIKSKYHLVERGFTQKERKQLWITTWRTAKRKIHHIIFNPDIIIRYGEKPEDRLLIEYVNTEGTNSRNFLRDFRAMTALECIMKERGIAALGFKLVLLTSFSRKYALSHPTYHKSKLDIMSLETLLNNLDRKALRDSCKID